MTKTYIITGTSRGIGFEMAHQLLESKNRVLALARQPLKSPGLIKLKESYKDLLEIHAVDITSDADILEFTNSLPEQFKADVLINNAGIYGEDEDLSKIDLDKVLKTIEVNALGPMRVTRSLLPYLKGPNPIVVHVTSLMGSIGDNSSGGSYAYRMSKAALNMFHKTFSIDFPHITSLVIHPGWVQTDMGGSNAPTSVEKSVRGILRVIEKASPRDSGDFLDYEGDRLPW